MYRSPSREGLSLSGIHFSENQGSGPVRAGPPLLRKPENMIRGLAILTTFLCCSFLVIGAAHYRSLRQSLTVASAADVFGGDGSTLLSDEGGSSEEGGLGGGGGPEDGRFSLAYTGEQEVGISEHTEGVEAEKENNSPKNAEWRFQFKYPPYCYGNHDLSKPELRQSPPLACAFLSKKPVLKQVQIVHRHGARTPFADHRQMCWPTYNPRWTRYVAPTIGIVDLTTDHQVVQGVRIIHSDKHPESVMTGVLLKEGVKQLQNIGELLKQNYLNSSSPTKIPSIHTPPLFNNIEKQTFVRSTNQERTIMSAASLFTSMTRELLEERGTTPSIRTSAFDQDYWYENVLQPGVVDAWKGFRQSGLVDFLMKKHTAIIRALKNVLNANIDPDNAIFPLQLLDCWYTSLCAKDHWKDLPSPFDPPSLNTRRKFDAFVNEYMAAMHSSRPYGLQFSRAAMRLAIKDIRNMIGYTQDTTTKTPATCGPQFKFVQWSAHDTSVMPILAALGGSVWPGDHAPYASVIILEIFETPDPSSNHYFRIIYNGEDRTPHFEGCDHASPCPLSVFFEQTSWVN